MNWWTNYPWRMIQTNLRETDMEDINAEEYAKDLADFGATVVLLNAAGIMQAMIPNWIFRRNPRICMRILSRRSLTPAIKEASR